MIIKNGFFQRLHSSCQYACVGLLAVLYTSYTHAIFGLGGAVYVGDRPNASIDVGYAMARSVVLDDAGNPYIVTFNEKGEEISLLLSGQAARDAIVASAAAYRQERQQLTDFKAQTPVLAQQAQLLSRIEYEQTTFTTASGEAVTPPSLSERVKSVLVRGPITRLPDANNLVLMRFGFNQAEDAGVGADARSLIVDEQGNVLQISPHTIGYRSGFFGSDTEPETGFRRITSEDKVYGPLARSVVKSGGAPGGGVVDDKGRFGFSTFFGVCPIGGYWYDYSLFTPVYYANRAPISAPAIPFYLKSLSSHYCYADLVPLALVPAVQSIIAARTRPFFQRRILLDVLFFTGDIKIQNIVGEDVPIGDTTYTSFDEDAEKRTQDFYDFNGDGASDTVVRGNVVPGTDAQGQPIERFIADSEGDKQGIFFDGSQDDDEFPDLIRLIDEERRITEPMGLLKSISSDDFRNTDLYLFRESTGQLLMERRGFKDIEDRRSGVLYDDEDNGFGYRLMFRGPDDSRLNLGGFNTTVGEGDSIRLATYEEWATQSQLTEPFRERRGDNVRTGEFIKLVAINRATGYTGTIRVQLGQLRGNSPGVVAPTLTLQPPNLRIWAQRNYEIDKGLTKGEEKTYTIGSEGASLTSDKTITIYTEWLDEAGLPLPAGLGTDSGEQYGLTGRLAKVVGAGSLAGVGNVGGNDLSEFPIGPGRKTQVVKVGDNLSSAEHFYVHVIGKPKDQECIAGSTCPAFDLPNNEPNLEGRPQLLTPFLVPLPNEDQYWVDYRNYRALLQQETNAETPLRPLPAYAWQYRPEYQFSQFGLEVSAINRQLKNAQGNVITQDILNLNDSINETDDLVSIFYSLNASSNDRLTPIDGIQELTLSLGEYEQLATLGSNQTVDFKNLKHLALINSSDLLTVRLYANNDTSNILWEWAFDFINLQLSLPVNIDQNETPISEELETEKGGMVFVNYDNDDNDNIFDHLDTDVQGDDDELAKIKIIIPGGNQGIVKLFASKGGSDIKLHNSKDKTSPISQSSVFNVPDDFDDESGMLVKTLWVEGIKAQNVQRATTLKVDFFNNIETFSDEAALTVIGVESLEWEGKGNSVNDDEVLDDDPNWPSGLTPVAQRVFPGARIADVNTSLDTVTLKVKLSAEPVDPIKLYLKPFDVDDPTADNNLVDNESTSDDNRGAIPNNAGMLVGADASNVLLLELSEQEATVDFQTTMQPGDNYRVAASFDEDFIGQLVNDDTTGASNTDRQMIVDGVQSSVSIVNMEVRESDKYVSPALTVWRFVHIERDSMGIVTGNVLQGNITSVNNLGNGNSEVITNITFNEVGVNRFENGELLNFGNRYQIINNSKGQHVRFEVVNIGNTVPQIGAVNIYDDDDFNYNNLSGKNGDLNENVTMPDINFVQNNDDSVCSDFSCNIFSDAYIRPKYDIGDNNSAVPFFLNTPSSAPTTIAEGAALISTYDFDQVATEASTKFWTVYLLGAYQMQTEEDCDGDDCTLGQVDEIGGIGASVFLEVTREFEIGSSTNEQAVTVAHELGHLFNGEHSDGDIMATGGGSTHEFSDITLNRIRMIDHP